MLILLSKVMYWAGIIFFGFGFIITLKKKQLKLTLASLVFIIIAGFGVSGLFDTEINETFGNSNEPKVKEVTTQNESISKIETTEEIENSNEPEPLVSGEKGYLADDVYIGIGEKQTNFDEMMSYIVNDNNEALNQMVLESRANLLYKGTPITVVDRGLVVSKIQLIKTGLRGWVPSEYLTREAQ